VAVESISRGWLKLNCGGISLRLQVPLPCILSLCDLSKIRAFVFRGKTHPRDSRGNGGSVLAQPLATFTRSTHERGGGVQAFSQQEDGDALPRPEMKKAKGSRAQANGRTKEKCAADSTNPSWHRVGLFCRNATASPLSLGCVSVDVRGNQKGTAQFH